jgi:hypothetical protein
VNEQLLKEALQREGDEVLGQQMLGLQEKVAAAQAALAVAQAEQHAGKQELLLTHAALAEQQVGVRG